MIQVESVIVAESGEDSDDECEWNYVKVDKDNASVEENGTEQAGEQSDPEVEHFNQFASDITASATSPSVGEPEFETHTEDTHLNATELRAEVSV